MINHSARYSIKYDKITIISLFIANKRTQAFHMIFHMALKALYLLAVKYLPRLSCVYAFTLARPNR
jgi:hypothetical protein